MGYSTNPERNAEILRMRREGMTAGKIAEVVDASRCAVMGVIHRAKNRGENIPTHKLPPRSKPKPRLRASVTLAGAPATSRASVDKPRTHPTACRWPIGDPRESDFRFCEAPTRSTYCARHRALAYASDSQRRRP